MKHGKPQKIIFMTNLSDEIKRKLPRAVRPIAAFSWGGDPCGFGASTPSPWSIETKKFQKRGDIKGNFGEERNPIF